ncbi:cytochrome b/b6 domain-containing protein [Silvibacterium acidisoli]|uniref:cytochrome b/b6 domain-containing protein n=1 Tax=Acidobacteriaceae bacterium ZG23-2 TaxID=2883246 RepID=UPI00406CAF1E
MPAVSSPLVVAISPVTTAVVRVQRKHHLLIRWAHWTSIPLLLGLILSGISIYWSSPIFQHRTDAAGNFDRAADIGIWLCAHVPGLHHYSSPPDWLYNHLSLGPGMLGVALRLHWFCAYLFMANGLLYVLGLAIGGGWRALFPRRDDATAALHMVRYYSLAPFALVLRRPLLHPAHRGKYNALQKAAYASVVVAGVLVVLTGWAIHKPMQLHLLATAFGGYNAARVWHFWLMCFFIFFVVPHVILVLADGWDTVRSMITGWSLRVEAVGEKRGDAQ